MCFSEGAFQQVGLNVGSPNASGRGRARASEEGKESLGCELKWNGKQPRARHKTEIIYHITVAYISISTISVLIY